MKFLLQRPQGRPMDFDENPLFEDRDSRHLYKMWIYTYREIAWPVKFRAYVPVVSIEIRCKKCHHIREIELNGEFKL